MIYQNILDEFIIRSKEIFSNNLTGIYLHGSMAMDCLIQAYEMLTMIGFEKEYKRY